MGKEKIWKYDDLITEYIVEKIRRGYETSCTVEEITDFLDFVSYFITFNDLNFTYNEVIENYIQGKGSKKYIWNIRRKQHDELPIVKQTTNGLIVPTYNLEYSSIRCDANSPLVAKRYEVDKELASCLNLFMERNCIKRNIDTSLSTDETTRQFCYNASAALILKIWNTKMKKYVDDGKWPSQCVDIKEFIIDTDLASIIKLPSMREDLINFYFIVSERMMHIAENDFDFRITNFEKEVLAKANFDFIMDGFDYIHTADSNSEAISIDREQNAIHNIIDRYNGIVTTTKLNDPKILKLVKTINGLKKKQ